MTARGEPVTDTVRSQLALFEYAEDAVTARERAPEYVSEELQPHTYTVEVVETHASEVVEPAGAVWPLGHAVHQFAEPPAEYVSAAHCTHEVPLR